MLLFRLLVLQVLILFFVSIVTVSYAEEFGGQRYVVYIDKNTSKFSSKLNLYKKNPWGFGVSYVRPPEGVRYEEDKTVVASYVPNDVYYTYQWYLRSIEVDKVWDHLTTSPQIVVAVIDTGVSLTHPDLADNIWINKDEIPNNGLDDDGNGYVDDYYGYDFVNGDGDPYDDNGHGTHVAGIIAAVMNNKLGVVGVFQVKLMVLKVLNSDGYGYDSDVAEAIYYAVDNGAKVISMSLGGEEYAEVLKEACDYAWGKGVVLVAAAGNDGEGRIDYPAAFSSVIAVGSVDKKDKLSSFSNYGDELEVVAPGEDIYSTYLGNSYRSVSGTSMSTPQVSGMAALTLTLNPSLSNSEVRSIIRSSTDDLGWEGRDSFYGFGKINFTKLFTLVPLRNSISMSSPSLHVSVNSSYLKISWGGNVSIKVLDNLGDTVWDAIFTGNGTKSYWIGMFKPGEYLLVVESDGKVLDTLYFGVGNLTKFNVLNVSIPERLYKYNKFKVNVTIINEGNCKGNITVLFKKDGVVFESKSLELAPQEVYTLSSNLTYFESSGMHNISIEVGNYTYIRNVFIFENLRVNISFSNTSGTPPLIVEINITISNLGDFVDNASVSVNLDGVYLYWDVIEVNPQSMESVIYKVMFNETGIHQLSVYVDGIENRSETITVTHTLSDFIVTYMVNPTTLVVGGNITVTSYITNTGGYGGYYVVNFTINGFIVDDEVVYVNSGETLQVTFRYTLLAPGTYNVTINDLPPTSVRVLAPNITVVNFSASPLKGVAPLKVRINVTVINSGEIAGNITVRFYVNGSEVCDRLITVDAGKTEYVTCDYVFEKPGIYSVSVNNLQPIQINVTAIKPWKLYDKNNDGKIDDIELLNSIKDWLDGSLHDSELLDVILKWIE